MKPTVTILLEEYQQMKEKIFSHVSDINKLRKEYDDSLQSYRNAFNDSVKAECDRIMHNYEAARKDASDHFKKINTLESVIEIQKKTIEVYREDFEKSDKKAGIYFILLILSLALLSGTVCALIYNK